MLLFLLCLAGLWAGAQNALAGGGSFITLPALMLTGLDARAANLASTIALFPGQVANGVAGRSMVSGTDSLSFRTLFIISIFGGAVGGLMLLATPPAFFAALVPWLVLFATTVFAWANFGPKSLMPTAHIGPTTTAVAQFLIAIYGGYFGGGIGFLMIAALSMAGLAVRNAGATKNALAGVMNASAVLIFLVSSPVPWERVVLLGASAFLGGQIGVWALRRANERVLKLIVIVVGVCLTIGLFWRGP